MAQQPKNFAESGFALETIVKFTSDAVISSDLNGVIVSWNQSAVKFFGFSEKEALGRQISIIFPAESDSNAAELFDNVSNVTRVEQHITLLKTKSDKFLPVTIAFFPSTNDDSEITTVTAIIQNNTQVEQTPGKLRVNERRLRGLIDNLFTFVGLLTDTGQIIEVNQTTLIASRLKPENFSGKKLTDTYYWSWSEDAQKQLNDAISRAARGETVRYDTMIRVEPNRFITIDLQIAPIFSADGKVSNLVLSAVDITERLQLEADLNRAARLSLAGELAAGLAHEIKNPLAGIQGAIDILLTNNLENKNVKSILRNIRQEIVRIDSTVRTLLDRTNPQKINFVEASLKETVRRAVQLGYYRVSTRRHDYQIKIESNLPVDLFVMRHDPAQIEDAVINLINNAVEAIGDNEGLISINLFKDNSNVVIEVSDTGDGISKTNLKNLFAPFFTTKKNGTGLGLVAVKRIADSHGGFCKVSSVIGEGSNFKIVLPVNFIQ